MRKLLSLLVSLLFLFAISSSAQRPANKNKTVPPPPVKQAVMPGKAFDKKYPSLLWEITGNGLNKPSYLFGTMHISDKLVFHLGDSFYNAIKGAEVVALETNPETWQDDYSKSVFFRGARNNLNVSAFRSRNEGPSDHMSITTFAIDGYDEELKAALAVEPSMINGMMYRTFGNDNDDFEEDTFLDMYIFQTGKKLGKKLAGVENFQVSEKLVMEAYRDMMHDQNKKRKSYDYEGSMTNPKKMEDAYRKGDLDLLDSLESLSVFSDAFQEKFLYKRNEIQANSIDSIIRKSPLFVGVGAAHLPGKRGVIEMLRKKGYKLRPVIMDDRNSNQKESIDKIRPDNHFITQTSDDGFYKVAIPGTKFYHFTDWQGMDVVQYADMINGAYYMVNRIKTNSLSWGNNTDAVFKKIDSLLYENVPGKILKKTTIIKNGYKGLDMTNRTRRGDCQRYQVFVTPFEVIIFKMSGVGEFVNAGEEAQEFFNSIVLQEYNSNEWTNYQPATGGFSIQLPHRPSVLKDNNFGSDRLEYASLDKQDGNSYLVMKSSMHNYSFIEEDTFELNLMDESFAYSGFIDKQLSHQFTTLNGYPALESKFKNKDGSYSSVKYVIQGPIYYAVVARYKNESPNVQRFLKSFSITPFIYPKVQNRVDTSLHFTVKSPVFSDSAKKDDPTAGLDELVRLAYEERSSDDDIPSAYLHFNTRTKLIGNDTIGEKIVVTWFKMPDYSYGKDSLNVFKSNHDDEEDEKDTNYIYKVRKQYSLPGGIACREVAYTDTGSSRLILMKSFYKNGNFFNIIALTDTLSKRSSFLQSFFDSFKPSDTLKGESYFTRKSGKFFKDLFSKDSTVAKTARKSLYTVDFDSLDVPLLKSAIDSLNWGIRDYLTVKKHLISELGNFKEPTITPWLKQLYLKVKDTSDLQNAILDALLSQRTKESFVAFKDLILEEPPIMDDDNEGTYASRGYFTRRYGSISAFRHARASFKYGRWSDLYDTLSLAKVIFPDILQLLNVDDYRPDVLNLLETMADSGFIKAHDYETYFQKIYIDARQLLKKQFAKESKDKIEKAGKQNSKSSDIVLTDSDDGDDDVSDAGNAELDKYAVLLMPFWEKNPGVQTFFEQLVKTQDRRLLYNTFILLLRNHHPVPDSLFANYAKLDQYRREFYEDLKEIKMTDKFPAQYKSQKEIAKSIFLSASDRYEKLDTIVFIDKLPVTYKHHKGYVYFFKYKRMRDDVAWQVASVGMQPENPDDIDLKNDDFTSGRREERKLEADKPVKVQIQTMLKEMLYSKRSSASTFYEGRSYSMYKDYLSNTVKSRRYRD